MVAQYPHTLTTNQVSGVAIANASGDYTAGPPGGSVSETLSLSPCRAEVNGAGAAVTLSDGTAYVFGALVQLPKSAPFVKEGAPVEVQDESGQIVAKGNVKRFSAGQLHSRLWV